MDILIQKNLPYCQGCAYHLITRNLVKAIEKLDLSPRQVILVSDIGCCGLIDSTLSVHTIHGLHGRSNALAFGIAAVAAPGTKVIVFQGDGGATIGLQHMLEAARLNIDMTTIVANNMVYGMTGGQPSGLTPCHIDTIRRPNNYRFPEYDVIRLADQAGAAYSSRRKAWGDFSDTLAEAMAIEGYSIVELVGCCSSYGLDNKTIKEYPVQDLCLRNPRPPLKLERRPAPPSLLTHKPSNGHPSDLKRKTTIVISGSAGEGSQKAGEILAHAGVSSGLNATKKSEYPITVGTGFSLAEVILSPQSVLFTGGASPDVLIVTSDYGLQKVKNILEQKKARLVIADETLPIPESEELIKLPFRKIAGGQGASLCAVSYWVGLSGIVSMESLRNACRSSKHAEGMLKDIALGESLFQAGDGES